MLINCKRELCQLLSVSLCMFEGCNKHCVSCVEYWCMYCVQWWNDGDVERTVCYVEAYGLVPAACGWRRHRRRFSCHERTVTSRRLHCQALLLPRPMFTRWMSLTLRFCNRNVTRPKSRGLSMWLSCVVDVLVTLVDSAWVHVSIRKKINTIVNTFAKNK